MDQPQPTSQPEKPKKKFYKRWWLWVLIIALIIAGFLDLLTMEKQIENPRLDYKNNRTWSAQEILTPYSEFNTSNWKTYHNSTYGYSFKYPSEWYLNERDNGDLVQLDDDNAESVANGGIFWIKLSENPDQLTPKEWVQNRDPNAYATGFDGTTSMLITDLDLNGLPGVVFLPYHPLEMYGGSIQFYGSYEDKIVTISLLPKESGLNHDANGEPENNMLMVFNSVTFTK